MYNLDQFQLVIGNQFEINREMNIFNFKHNIVGGLELVNIANNTRKRTTVVKMVYLFNQREITSGDFDDFITFPKISTNTSQWIGAVYLIDYIYLLDKLQLFCGGRLDYIDYYTDRRNAAFDYIGRSLSSEPVPFSRNFLKFSPMAGIVYKETANLIFYANAGQAFASGQRIVDQPETSKQYEFGYKYRSSNDLIRTIASFYRIKKENMSIPLTGPLQGNIHTSTGSQLVNGVEFEFIANPGFNWFLTLKSSFTYAEYIKYRALTATDEGKLTLKDFSGNVPLFVPAQISDIQVHKEFLNSLDFGLGLRYVSDQYANYENDYEIKDYMVYQFSFSYEINKFLFRLSVDKISRKNLLSRGLGPYSVIPIEPLEIRGSAGAYF
jgi:outer membrane receptor protein involved in Fe transport